MNIQLSDDATKKIEAVIGTSDPETVSRFFERIAGDEQLLQSFMLDDPNEEDIQAIREGIADADAGRVQSLAKFDAEFRLRNNMAQRDQS
jgi:hypothetical protein